MKRDDRREARAIAEWWSQYVYDKDTPVQATAEAAAGFAQAHALLAVADALRDVAVALRRGTA